MIEVILIEPTKPENLGSVARAIKNFDFSKLILIKPKVKKTHERALIVAKHGKDILKKAKVEDFSYLKKVDYLVGTSAILGSDYNIPRNPINVEQLGSKLSEIKKTRIGILIGREGPGLNNKEINMCDILVTIPASKKYPTLNISHSVAIILYEIFKKTGDKSNSHIKFADKKDKEIIMEYFNKILDKIKFSTKDKKETQKKVWKRVFGKSMLTKREAFSVMGLLRKILKK
jgi:TrmH family RNA methyltransferase